MSACSAVAALRHRLLLGAAAPKELVEKSTGALLHRRRQLLLCLLQTRGPPHGCAIAGALALLRCHLDRAAIVPDRRHRARIVTIDVLADDQLAVVDTGG